MPSMTKVLRSMPRTFLPYMFFILMTPNWVHSFSSASESSAKGNSIFALKFSCDFSESRETPATTAPSLGELRVQVAKLRAFGRAARRVVLRVEIEHDRVAGVVGQPEARRRCGSDLKSATVGRRSWQVSVECRMGQARFAQQPASREELLALHEQRSGAPVRSCPAPTSQRGSASGSTASRSARIGPSVQPCAFQPVSSCSNAPGEPSCLRAPRAA